MSDTPRKLTAEEAFALMDYERARQVRLAQIEDPDGTSLASEHADAAYLDYIGLRDGRP